MLQINVISSKSYGERKQLYLQYLKILMLFLADEKDMEDYFLILHVKWTINNHKYSYDSVQ